MRARLSASVPRAARSVTVAATLLLIGCSGQTSDTLSSATRSASVTAPATAPATAAPTASPSLTASPAATCDAAGDGGGGDGGGGGGACGPVFPGSAPVNCFMGVQLLLRPTTHWLTLVPVYLIVLAALVAMLMLQDVHAKRGTSRRWGCAQWGARMSAACGRGVAPPSSSTLAALFAPWATAKVGIAPSAPAGSGGGGENLLALTEAVRLRLARGHQSMTLADIKRALQAGRKWLLWRGLVVDVTQFMHSHPGGTFMMEANLGDDVSMWFAGAAAGDVDGRRFHVHSARAKRLLLRMVVGAVRVDSEEGDLHDWGHAAAQPTHTHDGDSMVSW